MIRNFILLAACLSLAACGGYLKAPRDIGRSAGAVRTATAATASAPVKVRRTATGPISRACMASNRKARSGELCGCIQAVANDRLSGADQRLAVTFYGDPHKAQEIRQSDNPRKERFWKSYKAYAAEAEASCG